MTIIIGIILVVAFVVIVFKILITDGKPSRRPAIKEHLEQDKPVPVTRDKQGGHNSTTGKTKTKKSNVVGDTAAVLAGAALAHKMMKHHNHNDTRVDTDDYQDTYDADLDELDDLYDMGIDDVTYDNSDYDSYREAYEEEQAAYDDFIASMDMDD